MNIFDIMKAYGVEVSAENKDKFTVAFNEQYKTKAEYDGLMAEKTKADSTVKTLTEKMKSFDGVDVEQLKKDAADWESKYNQDIANLKVDNEVNKVLFANNAKNITAVKALLKMDNVKLDNGQLLGLTEQLDALKKSDGYLFGEATQTNGKSPAGNQGDKNKETSITLEEFKKMPYLDRIKLKQENPTAFDTLIQSMRSEQSNNFGW